jgi:hypothetical protein
MGFHHHYVHGPRLMPRLLGGVSTGALTLLGSEADGLSIDFTDASLVVRDTTTTSNAWVSGTNGDVQTFWRDRSFTSYASPSPKITRDSAGLYTYRPHNYFPLSENFIATGRWSADNVTAAVAVVTPPSGATSVFLITPTAVNDSHRFREVTAAHTSTAAVPFTVSLYVKPNGYTQVALREDTTTGSSAVFNLTGSGTALTPYTTGVVTSIVSSIESVGDGWYRISARVTYSDAAARRWAFVFTDQSWASGDSLAVWTPNGTSGAYATGFQINAGPTALTYTKTQAHNLVLQSQTFETEWANLGSTETANSVAAPDGTTTADTITEDTNASRHGVYQSVTTVTGLVYTYSVYLKAGTATYGSLGIRDTGGATGHAILVDLSSGSVVDTEVTGSPASTAYVATVVGNGWVRLSATMAAVSTSTYIEIGISDSAAPTWAAQMPSYLGTSKTIYAWGAQVELASSSGKYVATTAAAVYSNFFELPREWNSSGACVGLLCEEARTNLCLRSQEFDNAAWTNNALTVTANAATAPDGTATADTLDDASSSGEHRVRQSISFTSGTAYTVSCFVKNASRSYIQLFIETAAFPDNCYANFDVATGVVGTKGAGATSSSITDVGNGWYRCVMTATADATAASTVAIKLTDSASATYDNTYTGSNKQVYAWGMQVEAGAFVTSPIYTGSASVTRAADNISLATSAFPYNSSAGAHTLYAHVTTLAAVDNASIVDMGADENARTFIYTGSSGTQFNFVQQNDSGIAQASLAMAGTSGADQTDKVALSAATNDVIGCNNGTLSSGDTSATAGTVATSLRIGSNYVNGAQPRAYFKQVMYLPRAMSDGQLQTVTT